MPVVSTLPLFIRVNDYLSRIEYSVEKAQKLIDAYDGETDDVREIALEATLGRTLHDVYSAYEKIFEDIADEVDGGKPNGDSWHQKLLQQMRPQTASRPPVIPHELHAAFDDLRSFRHVYRGSYGSDLRIPEMLDKHTMVRASVIPGMIASLQQLAIHLEDPFIKPESEDAPRTDAEGPGAPPK